MPHTNTKSNFLLGTFQLGFSPRRGEKPNKHNRSSLLEMI
jgi:hypothetical protein